jgi:ABC-2 type transport system permease protein
LPSRREGTAEAVSSFRWLVAKEYRELIASRAWWVLLLAMGPLVGVTFISAVRTYGEASGLNGTTAGVGEAFSPLIGIWAPTFSACEVAAVFLLPFVAIRLVSGDRQSGALKIEMQHPMPALVRIAAKAIVLLGAWLVA